MWRRTGAKGSHVAIQVMGDSDPAEPYSLSMSMNLCRGREMADDFFRHTQPCHPMFTGEPSGAIEAALRNYVFLQTVGRQPGGYPCPGRSRGLTKSESVSVALLMIRLRPREGRVDARAGVQFRVPVS